MLLLYTPLIITIVLAYIPSFAWLGFVLTQDVHPENSGDIAKAFILGSFISVPIILCAVWGRDIMHILLIDVSPTLSDFIFGAFAEEVIKGVSIYWFAISTNRWDEPIDTFIYAATLALGFAGIENLAFVLSYYQNDFIQMQELLVLRAFTSVIIHIISSFVFTYGVVFYSKYNSKIKGMCLMIAAILFHGLWNLVVGISTTFGSSILVLFYFLICIPIFIGMIFMVKHLRINSRRYNDS